MSKKMIMDYRKMNGRHCLFDPDGNLLKSFRTLELARVYLMDSASFDYIVDPHVMIDAGVYSADYYDELKRAHSKNGRKIFDKYLNRVWPSIAMASAVAQVDAKWVRNDCTHEQMRFEYA